jgi:hypothetical protein
LSCLGGPDEALGTGLSVWKRKGVMTTSAKDRLFSLLFEAERDLLNLKFCVGTGQNQTVETLFGAAHLAIAQALGADAKDTPPSTGRSRTTLRELVSVP